MTWLVIAAALLLLVGVAYWWRNRPQKLPDAWPLTTRKVFTKQEHEAYALMRNAFPDQAVLVKLPLSRFLQLTDTKNMKYWFGLLTPLYVTFAVCRVDGKVLSAIDFAIRSSGAHLMPASCNTCVLTTRPCQLRRPCV
jgi:hypothetical protein